MRLACDAGMAVDEVFALGLGEADEFIERLERRLRARDQHIRCKIGQADIAEAIHVVRQLLDMRLCREGIVRRQREGVAVGRSPAELDEAERAGGAGFVDDDHRLAQDLADFVLQRARHDVGIAARRKRHNHVDRPGGICLRQRSWRQERADGQCGRDKADKLAASHARLFEG